MKKSIAAMLICSFAFLSFCFVPADTESFLPLCSALSKVMKEEPSEFATLKGELVSDTDGSKTYASKVNFDGWISTEYVNNTGSISVDVQSVSSTKAKAQELFNSTAKQLGGCLEMKGAPLKAEGVDELLIFTKTKVDVALMLVTKTGKSFVMISISRES